MRRSHRLVLLLAAACHGAAPASHPVPEPADPPERGDAAAAGAVAPEDRAAIYAQLVGHFFRPSGGQARWIDPRPLAALRGAASDSAVAEDDDWAEGVREAAGEARVCVVDGDDDRCRGRSGGILRFSRPYADGDGGGARVFAVYTPVREDGGALVRTPGPVMESVFHLARDGGRWRIVQQRAVAGAR